MDRPWPARTLAEAVLVLIAVLNIGFVPPVLPGMQVLRDACWMTYGILRSSGEPRA